MEEQNFGSLEPQNVLQDPYFLEVFKKFWKFVQEANPEWVWEESEKRQYDSTEWDQRLTKL